MTDEQVTMPVKSLGRRRTFTEADAALAYDLYVVKDLPGEQVARAMGKPRTTILGMVREHEAHLQNLRAKAGVAPAPDPSAGLVLPATDEAVQVDHDTKKGAG